MKKLLICGVFEKVYIFLGTLVVLLPVSPMNAPYSLRDSGVFLFVGWRMLEGELPYVHVWDHKPPLVFFINALGQLLSKHSTWGVWLIEFLFLFVAAYIGYKLLKNIFGVFSAIIGTFIWLLALFFILSGGNLTTEYTLPFQFATLWIFWSTKNKEKANWHYFLIGVFGGVAFLFKQTSIGLWIAISAYLLVIGIKKSDRSRNFMRVVFIGLGTLVVCGLVIVYFLLNQGFHEFLDAAFLYNFYYSSSGSFVLLDRLMYFILGFDNLTVSTIFQYSMLGLVIFILKSKWKPLEERTASLLTVALISLPVELIFINLPGFTHPHYFITILPALSLFVGLLFYVIEHWISNQQAFGFSKWLAGFLILGGISLGSIKGYVMKTQQLRDRINEPVIQYVIENSDPDDPILLWGAETMVNYFAQRRSPSRYVYQFPLYNTGFTSEERIIEFLDDIIEDQPHLIIDTKSEGMPIFIFPLTSSQIENKIDYIKSIYTIEDEINTWEIYRKSVD